MTEWDTNTLARIAATDDLHIAPFREDGTTYGTPTWIWSVVVDESLYVRPWNGANSRWYKAAMNQGAGRITTAGGTYDVRFHAANPAVNDDVDAAYRAKYANSEYLPPMLAARPRAATVRITPA
ncbi:DUF2255 family protein [Sinomonas sp. G460-2]|uniref:DUF2255 family protein n=1 Tax=Sinomonas sp. G460-2 TaxID=3393464 RepID=UPI0039EF1E3A